MSPPTTSMPYLWSRLTARERGAADRTPAFALDVLRLRAQERQVLIEHVLDPEEHVAEAGPLHEARQLVTARRERARHSLHDVVDDRAGPRR